MATHSGRNVAMAVTSAAVAIAFGNAHVIPYLSSRHHENRPRLLRHVMCWKMPMTKVMMPALRMALTALQNPAGLPRLVEGGGVGEMKTNTLGANLVGVVYFAVCFVG